MKCGKKGVENAWKNPAWDDYDRHIQTTVLQYNHLHSERAGYIPIDWHWIKAIIWTECNPVSFPDMWKSRPMQIGNVGDPGLNEVLSNHNMSLIIPQELRTKFSAAAIRANGYTNIEAGIGYLLYRLAVFGYIQPVVKTSDLHASMEKHTTNLHKRKHKDKPQKVIAVVGWLPFLSVVVYMAYNIGDGAYPRKFYHALDVIRAIEHNGRAKQ